MFCAKNREKLALQRDKREFPLSERSDTKARRGSCELDSRGRINWTRRGKCNSRRYRSRKHVRCPVWHGALRIMLRHLNCRDKADTNHKNVTQRLTYFIIATINSRRRRKIILDCILLLLSRKQLYVYNTYKTNASNKNKKNYTSTSIILIIN